MNLFSLSGIQRALSVIYNKVHDDSRQDLMRSPSNICAIAPSGGDPDHCGDGEAQREIKGMC